MRIKTEKSIASIDYWEYFVPVFESQEKAKQFIESTEKNQKTRIITHQCARMLYLADKVCQRARPALDVLFFIIIAEGVAKIFFDFQGKGKSEDHVYKFFKKICSNEDKNTLKKSFVEENTNTGYEEFLTLDQTIELLYDVRCDVVHRGIYFDNLILKDTPGNEDTYFRWKEVKYITPTNSTGSSKRKKQTRIHLVAPKISTNDLRKIILKTVVHSCNGIIINSKI